MSKMIIEEAHKTVTAYVLRILEGDEEWLRKELEGHVREVRRAQNTRHPSYIMLNVFPKKDEGVETIRKYLEDHEGIDVRKFT